MHNQIGKRSKEPTTSSVTIPAVEREIVPTCIDKSVLAISEPKCSKRTAVCCVLRPAANALHQKSERRLPTPTKRVDVGVYQRSSIHKLPKRSRAYASGGGSIHTGPSDLTKLRTPARPNVESLEEGPEKCERSRQFGIHARGSWKTSGQFEKSRSCRRARCL